MAAPDNPLESAEGLAPSLDSLHQTPRHGFQGDRAPAAPPAALPAGLTIAVSREAGSRGNTIASRAGLKLGWPVYNQELLEYIAQEGASRHSALDRPPAEVEAWVEAQLVRLLRSQHLSQHPSVVALARVVLGLGAQGGVVLVGRGAGLILPPEATLHVRIVAPLTDRVAYMSQWLRLTEAEAAEQVRRRDARRAEFLATHFHRPAGDQYCYDLVLNSSLLGEELCADLLVRASQAKAAARPWQTAQP